MSQLLPGALLFLALVSTSFALEPYEAFCTSESDFNADAPLFHTCKGTDIQACKDAGGTYVEEEGKCDDIDTDTSEACENIAGYTYEVDSTCEQFGYLQAIPGLLDLFTDCTNLVSITVLPRIQSTCCGGASYNKDVCSGDVPKPYEAFCTSESDFNADVPLFHTCKGTDIQACKDAGGTYVEEEGKCDDIDTDTSEACENIAGYTYEVDSTCEQFGGYIQAIPGLFDQFTDCTDPVVSSYLVPRIQSTCCGGASYNKDVCLGAKTYEAFCTSESDFKADAPLFQSCKGTDIQACKDAGGTYVEEEGEGKCDDIDTDTSEACENIAGYTYKIDWTCGQFGGYIQATPELLDQYTNCTSLVISSFVVPRIQSICCGGASYNKDVCSGDVPKPYEAFCTSESDFKADAPLFHTCKGTDIQACKDAGGTYVEEEGEGKCDDIDTDTSEACENIAGYTYEVDSTCEQFGYLQAIPGLLDQFTNCTDPGIFGYLVPKIQSTCCGGAGYNKDICPNAITTTSAADICSKCDKNREDDGVSNDCYAAVTVWNAMGNEIAGAEKICGEPSNGSDVSGKCKAAILEGLDCVEGGNSSGEEESDGELSSASDFSKMVAMLFTALVMCWTHFA